MGLCDAMNIQQQTRVCTAHAIHICELLAGNTHILLPVHIAKQSFHFPSAQLLKNGATRFHVDSFDEIIRLYASTRVAFHSFLSIVVNFLFQSCEMHYYYYHFPR